MRNVLIMLFVSAIVVAPAAALGQPGVEADQGAAQAAGQGAASGTSVASTQAKAESPRGLRTRANVRVELTISDQTGNGPVEKKVVSLIAAEETWGKIRTQAAARVPESGPPGAAMPVGLNVDARPFLTSTGAIQLELTVGYNPLDATGKELKQLRPTELNQSMTVVLQSGQPMVISQAADPISDRKMIVEVVASILK